MKLFQSRVIEGGREFLVRGYLFIYHEFKIFLAWYNWDSYVNL